MTDRLNQICTLSQMLLTEMPQYRRQAALVPHSEAAQRRLLRSLMNLRPPCPCGQNFSPCRMPSCRPSGRKRVWST